MAVLHVGSSQSRSERSERFSRWAWRCAAALNAGIAEGAECAMSRISGGASRRVRTTSSRKAHPSFTAEKTGCGKVRCTARTREARADAGGLLPGFPG